MDVQNPPSSLSEEAPAAGTDAAAAAAAVDNAETTKTVDPPTVPSVAPDADANAEPVTTPAETTDSSDSVISTSDAPASADPSNGESEDAPDSVAKGEDQVDKAAASVRLDDAMMREMEAMEGSDKSSDAKSDAEPSVVDESAEGTKHLLSVLENDATEKTKEDESSVDSTTESTSKEETHSDEVPVAAENEVASASDAEPEAVDADEAMDVDETPVESPPAEVASIKDEAISSTSSEDVRAVPEAAVEPQSIDQPSADTPPVSHIAAAPASTEATPKVKDAVVTSTEDHPEVASNEADSSDVTPKVAETPATTESAAAVDAETTASAYELDQTLEMGAEPSTGRADNKLLTNMMNNGSSTPNSNPVSAAATPNVFNSTPISKQFEISSENVSKIDEHSTCEKTGNNVSSQDDIKSSDALTTFSGTDSTEPQSSDNLTHFANVIKKYNGLGSDSLLPNSTPVVAPLLIKSDSTTTAHTANLVALSNGSAIDDSTAQGLRGNDYEISVWYEDTEMQYLAVERLPNTKKAAGLSTLDASTTSAASSSSDKTSTTNGSVTSVGPFSLGPARDQTVSSNSSTDTTKFAVPTPPTHTPLIKQSVSGAVALCNFMIEHFGKIKQQLGATDDTHTDSAPSTPVAGRSGKAAAVKKNLSKTAAASPSVVSTPKNKRAGKRTAASDTEEEPTQKKAKPQKKEPEETSLFISVLARWTDKKYYAGHATDKKPGGKYVVLFEDGASKTLSEEFIVFGGENSALPLLDQAVHVLVGGDTYEPGLVTEINTTGAVVLYTVIAESKTVTVSSSDIYLEEDQAKIIQNSITPAADIKLPETPSKRAARPTGKLAESSASAGTPSKRVAGAADKKTAAAATSPEPSTSGAAGRAGRRNNKRKKGPAVPMVRSFSESSELSDTADSQCVPESPVSGLEAVDGVQPELQKTPRKGELNKVRIMSEYLGDDRTRTIEDVIGRTMTNLKLFRNKHFLLTCTINSKKANTGVSSSTVHLDDHGKPVSFSTLPFVKEHLRQQIESGGGTVYNYFEEIPKDKYKLCKIIAANPNSTAKYVQCIAANIGAISHDYIIQSCQQGKLVNSRRFQLPIGWSITDNCYVRWPTSGTRKSALANTVILVGSYSSEFTEFWLRVCRLAGADVRHIQDPSDIGSSARGAFMVTDLDFCEGSKSKADFFGVEIVSTVWVVESLVLGRPCPPDANAKLRQSYQDEDY